MTDTMHLWNKVSKTNPDNTKKVNQRGGFTSICAQSQIMEATRAFGPIGQGWGYIAEAPIFHDNLVLVRVTLWHGDRENTFGPVIGGAEWKVKERLDSDAPKKATTDAITKLLSQLGFNADVFLGLYDDSKYVAQVTREFAPEPEPKAELPTGPINDKTRDWVSDQLHKKQIEPGELCRAFEVTSLKALTYEQINAVKDWLSNYRKAA
ncbi:hypothetical protein [Novosphingobium sp. MMS21-SN21R]|uniref:hypothetical protein n=1 Tax=Novosphingobium sp. MMS21-SN21R TaxID=2969298 RepID=UPI00288625B2|nr:hypothetical protein [Novosphingobium sp. MMS21-SN21R]MDT0507502.1 hypothetical protein [Novosphingobium sp. MMS21-SN21R]MDT0509499.1 hypothetical protein [Novosphingobium sp. MMS21-SN21R]